MGVAQAPATARWQWALAGVAGLGLAVAAALAAYADAHPGDGQALLTLWFSGMLPMKSWLTTAAALLVVVQVVSALALWGRLPGVHRDAPAWVALAHRWSGVAAFLLTLPVAFQCVWSLGFEDDSPRVVLHGAAGCLFYGAFAAKMLALRLPRLPSAVLPVLGALVAVLLVVVWFTSAAWFFTQPGFARV